jgi:hypothetical protein
VTVTAPQVHLVERVHFVDRVHFVLRVRFVVRMIGFPSSWRVRTCGVGSGSGPAQVHLVERVHFVDRVHFVLRVHFVVRISTPSGSLRSAANAQVSYAAHQRFGGSSQCRQDGPAANTRLHTPQGRS